MNDRAPASPKRAWILSNLRCTSCLSSTAFTEGHQQMTCADCGASYPMNARHIDMLPAALKLKFNLTDTDKVSEHPYDPKARSIIAGLEASGGMALDCGSGCRSTRSPNLIQLEIVDYPNVDVLGVNQSLPFKDGVFDAVFSFDVLEHVDDPFQAAREIVRVLKPGGMLYVDVPFMQNEHGYPEHYFNMTRMGLRRLFRDGMDIEEHWVPKSGHPLYTLYFVIMSYLAGLPKKARPDFEAMTIGDFVKSHPKDFYEHPIFTQFAEDRRWSIASTTRAIMKKKAPQQA